MMETKSVSETSVNYHHLLWLSAHKHFTEFCSVESFDTYSSQCIEEVIININGILLCHNQTTGML
jgi:hypothetical protein